MRVQDVMTDRVHTISPAADADVALNLMRMRTIHHLVVTEAGRIVGVLSARDVDKVTRAHRSEVPTVADLMTRRVVTVPPATPIRRAANVMRGHSIGCLVVVSEGRIVGIVTIADLLEFVGRGVKHPVAAPVRGPMQQRVAHKKRQGERKAS